MRLIVAALCALALTGTVEARERLVGKLDACEAVAAIPAQFRAEPTVRYDVFRKTPKQMGTLCKAGASDWMDPEMIRGCTIEKTPGYWPVYVAVRVPAADFECIVSYEKSHMPPNYWGDPKMERPETIKWLRLRKTGP